MNALVAFKNGDFTYRLPNHFTGIEGKIADTFNDIAQIETEANAEAERVSIEVGQKGKLNVRANLISNTGSWKAKINSINKLIVSLSEPLINITQVVEAVSKGDLAQVAPLENENGPLKNELLRSATAANKMVSQLDHFSEEVLRVTREVGTEGKLGGHADVKDAAGVWKELTNNVNLMVANLTDQMRNISDVNIAVANGDLSKKITVDARGEILQLKETINSMVEQLRSFSSEVTRVAREVGTDGKLGGQAVVMGVAGTWRDLTDNVNIMAANLTTQVRAIAEVASAVADGDLNRKITVEARGEILGLKNTINKMVEQLSAFASEVTRVSREVGTEGKLGSQGVVEGVGGTWRDLTDNVNFMAANLTTQVRAIAEVATAVAEGDLNKKITVEAKGEIGDLRDTINTMVDRLSAFASEVTRVSREVGTEGKLGSQGVVEGVGGTWRDLTDNVNFMAANLTTQVRAIAKVATAVVEGDLNQKITVEAQGEIGDLRDTINTMVDQLSAFASEVTRVAREVGTEGKLGSQGVVEGVGGTWRDLTDNVNFMAANLTTQVRAISEVASAVVDGDLQRKIDVEAQGEILDLKNTINRMVDQLSAFASEVTRVSREVGSEGKLGGQAVVKDIGGIWKELTDNVNGMAANLTTQVRAIAGVAKAVTRGDLNQSIEVAAKGELSDLKNNVNRMINNLRDTTKENAEQDWLKSNLARFTNLLQGERDLIAVSKKILSELAPLVGAHHGAFYLMDRNQSEDGESVLRLLSSYAYKERKNLSNVFHLGEGLVGQCALEKQRVLITHAPDDYVYVVSGLGESVPRNIVVLPVLFEDQVVAVIELASLDSFSNIHLSFLDQLMENIGIVINNIIAVSRTEELLKQSQSLTEELQTQQEELQQTNEELEEKADALNNQKQEVEKKNAEIETARIDLEEKAEQLAITSKYKSEFLANMSHELRTPLNSLLILAKQLMGNQDKNLTEKQVKFASTIYDSGSDLLNLINDILDLSKVESGTVTVNIEEIPLQKIKTDVEDAFQYLIEQKKLKLSVKLDKKLPKVIKSDAKRLQQVINNLMSNAIKFTSQGSITLKIAPVEMNLDPGSKSSEKKDTFIAFSVIDTGIGIPVDKQKIIFEAFQQADSGTSRKYGGTGLGLAISREIAQLLGGELKLVKSETDKGSEFALFLPVAYSSPLSIDLKEEEESIEAKQIELKRQLFDKNSQKVVKNAKANMVSRSELESPIPDDRLDINPEDKTLLIVEDDVHFAPILLDVAHEQGFKGLIALDGHSALILAEEFKPSAITLDINLPDINGLDVLDYLKKNPETMHIPVHIISVIDEPEEGIRHGAFAYLKKPVERKDLDSALKEINDFTEKHIGKLLVVEDDPVQRTNIVDLMNGGDVKVFTAENGSDAMKKLAKEKFDCMVLDLKLPDMSGFDLLEKIHEKPELQTLPIIVYTSKKITRQEESRLMKIAKSVILKDVRSPERLLAETSLFLHRVAANLPDEKRKVLESIYDKDTSLEGKKVLVVDDDVRNIFALTSLLEGNGVLVSSAESGKEAIKTLKESEDIEIVLMDIMMPEMDGYETIQRIRKDKRFKKLPIIALTAKAMKGDREKCISVGASDYIPKPVNSEQLLSLLRIWLHK